MGHIRVDLPNTNNKWVGFGLTNVDTFIIRVKFWLTNVDTIRTLTRHEHDSSTRIDTPTYKCLLCMYEPVQDTSWLDKKIIICFK